MEALLRRFTPVTIQSVQTSQLHERKQRPQESVDTFAQDLRQLFWKAYASVSRGSQEAEEMGKAVLASQFLAGLHRDIKAKQAGCDGDLEQLLVKVRFEEAKIRDLGSTGQVSTARKPASTPERTSVPTKEAFSGGRLTRDQSKDTCHGCGGTGHYIHQCPYHRTIPKEAKEQSRNKAATLVPNPRTKERVSLPTDVKWQDAAVEQVLNDTLVTLRGVKPTSVEVERVILGPTPITTVQIEGMPAEALLDTRSPVTIVSLDYLVKALTRRMEHCGKKCHPRRWEELFGADCLEVEELLR